MIFRRVRINAHLDEGRICWLDAFQLSRVECAGRGRYEASVRAGLLFCRVRINAHLDEGRHEWRPYDVHARPRNGLTLTHNVNNYHLHLLLLLIIFGNTL